MRVIFVPVADRPECAVALSTAFTVGQTMGASVIGCHIRPHGDSPISMPSSLAFPGLTSDDAQWYAAWKKKNGASAGAAAKKLFARVAAAHGYKTVRGARAKPCAIWKEKTGSPQKVIGIMGPMADLLVVSRPAKKNGTLARMFLSASLLKSSRPVLVLPQTKKQTACKRICIAWNQSAESAQAVAAAMPMLIQAEQVTIVTSGAENRAGPKSSHLSSYLKYWGIKAKHISGSGDNEVKEILEGYKSSDSDLLVMGAYSRSRISELVFGGVTEHMLNRTSTPILTLHT